MLPVRAAPIPLALPAPPPSRHSGPHRPDPAASGWWRGRRPPLASARGGPGTWWGIQRRGRLHSPPRRSRPSTSHRAHGRGPRREPNSTAQSCLGRAGATGFLFAETKMFWNKTAMTVARPCQHTTKPAQPYPVKRRILWVVNCILLQQCYLCEKHPKYPATGELGLQTPADCGVENSNATGL